MGNTIERAETVHLDQNLSIPHCHLKRIIVTDSLQTADRCAMYMLSKHLRCPSLHRDSNHLSIPEAAVEAMAEALREDQVGQEIRIKSRSKASLTLASKEMRRPIGLLMMPM